MNAMFNMDRINFEVEKAPLYHSLNFGGAVQDKLNKNIGVLIRRKDTQEPMAIVKDS